MNTQALQVVDWQPELMDATVDMLSRAFGRNPIHRAAFGDRAVECNRTFFRAGLSLFRGRRLVALQGQRIVGFAHWVEAPGCQHSAGQRARLLPVMLGGFGVRSTIRVGSWLSAWARHDAEGPHSHFGPIGVDPEAQGCGVGRALMVRYCAGLDDASAPGYLETDEPRNVAFYQRFGFQVIQEAMVIGTPTFFMARPVGRPLRAVRREGEVK
jgi:GNAT superfamily N-acetyltransferase